MLPRLFFFFFSTVDEFWQLLLESGDSVVVLRGLCFGGKSTLIKKIVVPALHFPASGTFLSVGLINTAL